MSMMVILKICKVKSRQKYKSEHDDTLRLFYMAERKLKGQVVDGKLPLSLAKKLVFPDPYGCMIFQLERMEDEENGLTAGGWIVLIILIMIVLRQNKRDKARRRAYRSGCGCSPLGWIIGLLGLGFLFNKE